jgi:asparaginyl-tRNA synthetase
MQSNGMVESELEWYKDLRKWGSIPHGGLGLGFDRIDCMFKGSYQFERGRRIS